MDFTLETYRNLLSCLQSIFENFLPFKDCLLLNHSANDRILHSTVILRHDVDLIPQNALKIAQLESSLGIRGTYYFRIVPESYHLTIMSQIAGLGHEIGYHYEDVDLVLTNNKELYTKNKEHLIDAAYESFSKNLELFRQNFEIKTICMHGSPRAKYDNRMLWEKYNYKELGLIGEPYFDIDVNEFAYFTDTGRRWNGSRLSVRDKVDSKYDFDFSSTQQIIDNRDRLPSKIMFTIHPQRWHDSAFPWLRELIWQNAKNIIKTIIIKSNKSAYGGMMLM